MKIVLTAINAKYIHSNLALRNFVAYTADCSEHLVLKEYTINHAPDQILQGIYRERPDVLCISCYIWNIASVETLIREFHKLLPEVPIWLGGPEVSFESETFLSSHPEVTGIMRGEGEDTFAALARYYVYGSPEYLEDIPGLIFRQDGQLRETGESLLLPLDHIPFCYDNTDDLAHRIVYYESSRGCPFRCSYCLSSLEKTLRFRSLDLVKEELSFFVEQEIPQVKFVDRTFNCDHEHAMAIWCHIRSIDRGKTNFHFEVSADLFREDELALLSTFRPGLIQLEIGVQSTNPATISEIHRQMDLPRLKEVVTRIRAWHNIHMHLDLIAGLPYEDYDTFARSFDEIFALSPSQLQLGFLKVLKGSYMYEHAKEYGILRHEAAPYEVLSTKWLSFDDVLRIKRVEEMLEVYYNSWQYALTVRLFLCIYPSAFQFFQRLGDYYDDHGLFGCSHSRLARCEILLDFLQEELENGAITGNADDLLPLFREALIYDLYARENCKRRPDWACDLTIFKQEIRARNPENKGSLRHTEVFHYAFPLRDSDAISALPPRTEEPLFYRFNYEVRDPLTYQATVECI
ncbi:MAG: B12-binding domain-containing radical SAM protein [Eubacterium sp.]|nr:B12-binding domain-containing radical SAM protein [Eubacterium sp.]